MWQFKYEAKSIWSSKIILEKSIKGISKMSRKNKIPSLKQKPYCQINSFYQNGPKLEINLKTFKTDMLTRVLMKHFKLSFQDKLKNVAKVYLYSAVSGSIWELNSCNLTRIYYWQQWQTHLLSTNIDICPATGKNCFCQLHDGAMRAGILYGI